MRQTLRVRVLSIVVAAVVVAVTVTLRLNHERTVVGAASGQLGPQPSDTTPSTAPNEPVPPTAPLDTTAPPSTARTGDRPAHDGGPQGS